MGPPAAGEAREGGKPCLRLPAPASPEAASSLRPSWTGAVVRPDSRCTLGPGPARVDLGKLTGEPQQAEVARAYVRYAHEDQCQGIRQVPPLI